MQLGAVTNHIHDIRYDTVVKFRLPLIQCRLTIGFQCQFRHHIISLENFQFFRILIKRRDVFPYGPRSLSKELIAFFFCIFIEHIQFAAVYAVFIKIKVFLSVFLGNRSFQLIGNLAVFQCCFYAIQHSHIGCCDHQVCIALRVW